MTAVIALIKKPYIKLRKKTKVRTYQEQLTNTNTKNQNNPKKFGNR